MDVAVEFFTLSKATTCPAGELGFVWVTKPDWCTGSNKILPGLWEFYAIQVAAIAALEGDQQCVSDITEMYKRRRDVLCDGLNAMGWEVTPQKQRCLCGQNSATIRGYGVIRIAKLLIDRAKVAVSPALASASMAMITFVLH